MRGGLFGDIKKNVQRVSKPKKNQKGDILVSSGYANARRSFWLKQGPEPATAGFP